jgi:predicted heme/steroid binding protein
MRILLAILLFAALTALGQSDGNFLGVNISHPSPPTPQEQENQRKWYNFVVKHIPMDGILLRTVDGKIYDVSKSKLWKVVGGQVFSVSDSYIIVSGSDSVYSAIKNYPGDAVDGKSINVLAMRTGTYNWNDTPLAIYDCGKPYVPPPPTAEQIQAEQQAAKAAADQQKQKAFLAQSNAVVWLQPQVTNGDSSAQYSLGLHYLNGQGCETNRDLAVFWLTKATAQGDVDASNKLVTLKAP